jgi:Fur family ferric uptake transcriptional regulator
MNGAGWQKAAEAALARAGYRRGGARQAVVCALAEEGCALTVPELEERLRRRGARASRASIYRALEQLEELGLVAKVATGDAMARYERLSSGGEHHHHYVCERCGRVSPFFDEALEEAIGALAKRLPGTVNGHEIQLRGWCARCAVAGGQPGRAKAEAA